MELLNSKRGQDRRTERALKIELTEKSPEGINGQTLSSRKEGEKYMCNKEERRQVRFSKRFQRKSKFQDG